MSDDSTEDQDDLVKKLTAAVEVLTGVVTVLSDRLRRKRISDAVLAGVVAALVGFVAYYILVIRPGGKEQIRNLACYAVRLRPPGYSPTSDGLRSRYHCPPFTPDTSGATPTPTPTPSSSSAAPGATSTPRSAQRPSAPASRLTVTSGRRAPASAPTAHTATRRADPAPTPPRAVTSTGPRDASPSVPPLIQLPSVSLCDLRVAGIGICHS